MLVLVLVLVFVTGYFLLPKSSKKCVCTSSTLFAVYCGKKLVQTHILQIFVNENFHVTYMSYYRKLETFGLYLYLSRFKLPVSNVGVTSMGCHSHLVRVAQNLLLLGWFLAISIRSC